MQLDVGIAGNSYIRNVGDGTIERLRPDWVTIVSTVQSDVYGRSVRRVIGYVYDPIADTDRDIEYYTVDEVAHWAPIPDPEANWRGMSWITPVLHEVNADLAMSKYRDTYFRRGATPSSIVKYQRRLTSAQKIAVRDSIMARHGGPDNAGSVLVFDQGADFQVIGTPVNEMHAVVQAAGENRMAVAAGVPAIVAGLREGVQSITQMNYTPATQLFINISMRPEWRSMCDSLSTITTVPDGAELWYDVTDVAALQQGEQEAAATMQQQSATVNTLITAGYTPESVISAVSSGDLTLLKHSGRVSVQLFEPGTNEVSDAQ
jgi:phage portal protein BeeE